MSAYAVGHFYEMNVNSKLVLYLNRIDATLKPYDGRFLVHGKKPEPVEGAFSGQVVIIEFPDIEKARGWYHSEAYQDIVALRKKNTEGHIVLVEGTPDDYQATNLLGR
jgi:uncharacterized protein (DUF1330 family)